MRGAGSGPVNDERLQPQLRIDHTAIAANTRLLHSRTKAALMAVVKADAFGHGAVETARTVVAHGATQLGVTTLAEALELRGSGVRAPILSWLNAPDTDFSPAVDARVDLAVPSTEHLRAASAGARKAARTARIHLHMDVGMARDGAAPHQWPDLCTRAAALEAAGTVKVTDLMGHLGCADRPEDPHNRAGRDAFAQAGRVARQAGLRPAHHHLAATSALLNDPSSHHDLVRVGAGLYGIAPASAGLRFAATLTAPVVSVRDVPANTAVGYAHTWTTHRPTRLALLPIGYADGLPRATSHQAHVLVRGRPRTVAGMFSMDQIVIDVGDDPIAPGEPVTILGPGDHGEPTPADWAGWAQTIPHELLTALGTSRRIIRRHLTHPVPPAPARLLCTSLENTT